MAAAYHRSHVLSQAGGGFSLPKDHITNNSPARVDDENVRHSITRHGISDMLARLLEEKKFMRP